MKDTFVVSCTENLALAKAHRVRLELPGFVNLVAFVPNGSDWAELKPGTAYVIAVLDQDEERARFGGQPSSRLNPTPSPDFDGCPATKRTGR